MQYPHGPQYGGQGPYTYGMPPAPKKSGLSGLAVFAIVAGCAFSGCAVCVGVATHKTPEQRAQATAEKKAAEDEAKREEAKRAREKAVRDAADAVAQKKLQKACKFAEKSDFQVKVPTTDDVVDRCQAMVKMSAKVPSSVDFPSEREDTRGFTTEDGCRYIYQSWFDGQNSFGVKIRTHYRCSFDPITTMPSVKAL